MCSHVRVRMRARACACVLLIFHLYNTEYNKQGFFYLFVSVPGDPSSHGTILLRGSTGTSRLCVCSLHSFSSKEVSTTFLFFTYLEEGGGGGGGGTLIKFHV